MASLTDSAIGILFKLQADASGATAEIKKFNADVKKETDEIGDAGENAFNRLAQSIGLSAEQTATLSAALPAIGAGLAAAASAAAGAATGLFALAKSSSDFGSEINDANQKTGIAVDTLQAIRFAATQGGISFDQAVTPISKFAKVMGDAESGSKKAKDTLATLGVTSKDLTTGLSQAYQTILKYGEGIDQMAVAQKAFGKSGAELLPFLKEFGGNLSDLTKRARDLGLILSDEDIKAADKFGDTFDLITLQLKTSAARIALEYAPIIIRGMNEVSKFLTENQESFRMWGVFINTELSEVLDKIKARGNDAEAAGAVIGEEIAKGIGFGLSEGTKALGNYIANRLKEIFSGKDIIDPIATGFVTSFWEGVLNAFGANQKFIDEVKANIIYGFYFGLESIEDARKQVAANNPAPKQKSIADVRQSDDTNTQPAGPQKSLADDEQRKAAEKLAKDNFAAIQSINSENLKENEKSFKLAQESRKDHYKALELTADQYRRGFILNEQEFVKTQKAINDAKYNNDIAQETNALKQKALIQKRDDADKDIDQESKNRIAANTLFVTENEKRITAEKKRAADERFKIAEDEANRTIEYYKADDERQIAEAERDKAASLAKIDLDDSLSQYEKDLRKAALTDEKSYQKKIADIRAKGFADETAKLEELLNNENISAGKKTEINQKIKILNQQIKTDEINASKEMTAAEVKDSETRRKAIDEEISKNKELTRSRYADGTRPRVVAGQPVVDATPQKNDIFSEVARGVFGDNWKEQNKTFQTTAATMKATAQGLGGVFHDLFANMKQALESSIENWILYGESIGDALKKALAAELAHVAGLAAIKALEATALGFFDLAIGNFGQAANAFISAGLWGALAVGSGYVARNLAGDSFKNTSSTAASTAGAVSSGSTGSTETPINPRKCKLLKKSLSATPKAGLIKNLRIW